MYGLPTDSLARVPLAQSSERITRLKRSSLAIVFGGNPTHVRNRAINVRWLQSNSPSSEPSAMRPSVATSLRQTRTDGARHFCFGDALCDQRFHRSKPLGPTSRESHATHERARKGRIDLFEFDRLVRNRVHRQPQEQMRADRRESHHHEVPLAHRLRELVSRVQPNDPRTVARGPFAGTHRIQASMRLAEIQHQRHFGGREVALLNRQAKVARTREVAVDVVAQAGIGGALRRLPLAEFGCVFAGLHFD